MPDNRDDDPRFVAWLIAALSLVLPFIGAVLAFIGVGQLYRGGAYGWLLWLGAGCFILDLVIDFWWAHPSVSRSDQPDLNARGLQLVGRIVTVDVAIENGRGKVRIGDTLWPVVGDDCPTGTIVKIIATRSTALIVDIIDGDEKGGWLEPTGR